MTLTYNGVSLDELGLLQCAGKTVAPEPADAPQRQRVSLKYRLHLTEQSYLDNQTLVDQLMGALSTQQAELNWEDGNGNEYVNRTVVAAQWEQENPEDWGTYYMVISFTFSYVDNDITSNCLSASWQAGKASLDMGAVLSWEEGYSATHFDPMRPQRKLVQGEVTASGRYQVDTTQTIAQRQAALMAMKDTMLASLVANAQGTFVYGSFNQTVRVKSFKASVNQPMNGIDWSLTVFFTRYPNELNYSVCEFKFGTRIVASEGTQYMTLSGRIAAPTAALAQTQLAAITDVYIPDGFLQLTNDTEQNIIQSNQTTGSNPTGDGSSFVELTFNLQFRDITTLTATFQRTGRSRPLLNLGTVEKWSQGITSDFFHKMRDQRRRVEGTISARGTFYQPDSVALADKQAALQETRDQFMSEITAGATGTLIYGTFDAVVRLLDFHCDIDRLQNCINWSVSAQWTMLPDETNYAICEFTVDTKQNKTEGTVTMSLKGKIGAPSELIAQTKLAALQTQFIPDNFVMTSDDQDQNLVEMDSDGAGEDGGQTFLELSFSQEWIQHSGDVVRYELRSASTDDARTGWVRKTYSGTVQATGPDPVTAYNTAAAQAAELGSGLLPMQLQSSVTEVSRQFLTSGFVFITVEFSYEYQVRGSNTFFEVTSVKSVDTFGTDTETVSGTIQAPTLADAQATYNMEIRGMTTYAGALLLNERTPTLCRQALIVAGEETDQDDRFEFSFTVHRPKTGVTCRFAIEPTENFLQLDVTTVVRGSIFAPDEATAISFMNNLLEGFDFGVQVGLQTRANTDSGPMVNGTAQEFFKSMEFTATFVDILSGVKGILECSIVQDVQYAGTRWVGKPIPDNVDIMQNCGTQRGRRTITVSVRATTEATVDSYIAGVFSAMIGGPFINPPKVATTYTFLPLTTGIAEGEGANVKVYEGQGVMSEELPGTTYAG